MAWTTTTMRRHALELWRQGVPYESICTTVGVSSSTLDRWVRAAGLSPRRKVDPATRELMRQLWLQGWSVRRIAEATGRSIGALRRAVHDLPRRRTVLTADERAEIWALRDAGNCIREIRALTGRGRSTVKRVLAARARDVSRRVPDDRGRTDGYEVRGMAG